MIFYGTLYATTELNSSQLAKMKKGVFLTCPGHEIYRDKAVGQKSCQYILKITIYVNNIRPM